MENSPELRELINSVNEKFGKVPASPSDFIRLSENICKATGIAISVSTLKRLWGYVKGYQHTRMFTIDVLCKYVGTGNWKEFLKSIDCEEAQSDFFTTEVLYSDTLSIGDLVEVTWQPNRHCLFRYLGENTFIVEKAENAKIKVGDKFRCDTLRDGQPLYLDELSGFHRTYVAGASDGVLFRLFPEK